MPNITRATTRSGSSQRPRLLYVRQSAPRSVRSNDEPRTLPSGLTLGIIVGLGVLLTVWLVGHLGFRLGFAPLVRVPDLSGESGGGLATGTMIVTAIPRVIFHAGLREPLWLMIAFVMIAIPAAALSAAKPAIPGGPKPKQEFVIIAATGAVFSIITSCLLVWWTGSPLRSGLVRPLPLDPAAAAEWHQDLQIVAGLDVLAVVTAALWVVLMFRLPVPLWLKAIATSAALFTLVVVTVAMSITNAAAVQIGSARSLCMLDDAGSEPCLMLGSTPQFAATLIIRRNESLVELRSYPDAVPVTGRQSIVQYLTDRAPALPE